jgi:hypothetical protein
MKDKEFSHYLAGLIEGDGYFFVPKSARSAQNKKNYPKIEISFGLKDLPLAIVILQRLGHGSLHRKKGVNAYVLSISSQEGCSLVAHLINGKMRTDKIKEFSKFLDYISFLKYGNFVCLGVDKTDVLSNSWLSGFSEADACFYIRNTLKPRYVAPSYYLEQCFSDNTVLSKQVLENISQAFSGQNRLIFRKGKGQYFRVRTISLEGNLRVIDYFQSNPLFGSKFLDFLDWSTVLNLVKTKKHRTEEAYSIVRKLKENMNSNRKVYDWTHLSKFNT